MVAPHKAWVALACALVLHLSCSSAKERPTLIVSGQSVAAPLARALSERATVIGVQLSAQPIAFWDDDGEGWRRLAAAIDGHREAAAFVWCQGENDVKLPAGEYRRRLAWLVQRVRARTRPELPLRLCELGPLARHDVIKAEQAAYLANDPLAKIIPTNDLPFESDAIHPTPAAYLALSARVLASIE